MPDGKGKGSWKSGGRSGEPSRPIRPRGEAERPGRGEERVTTRDPETRISSAPAGYFEEQDRQTQDMLFGMHSVMEMLRAHPARILGVFISDGRHDTGVREVVRQSRAAGVRVEFVPGELFRRRFPGPGTQGLAARVAAREPVDLERLIQGREGAETAPWVVLLDGVEDPRNLGAIARSAEASGASGLILPSRRTAPLGATAARASAGAVHHLPYAVVPNLKYGLDSLRQAGMKIVALEAGVGIPPWEEDLRGPLGVVVGSEGKGVRGVIQKRCDRVLSIPMPGNVNSLNVSVAAGMLFYEILAQRMRI